MGIFLVERGLERFQIFAGALKERVRDVAGDARGHDSRIGHAGIERSGHELALVWRIRSGDEQHRLRAMLARQHRLVAQPGVAIQLLPPLRIDLLRHVAQDERDLVFHIHSGIRIVALGSLARHGQAVADKHDFAVDRLVLRERKRREILFDLEPDRLALRVPAQNELVLFLQHPHAGVEFELLEKGVVVAGRIQFRLLQTRRDVIRRLFRARASRHPALAFLGGQEPNFLPEIGGRDLRRAASSEREGDGVAAGCAAAEAGGLWPARGDCERVFSAAS